MRRFVSYGPALVVLLTILAMLTAAPALVRRMETEQTRARVMLARESLDDGDDILERLNKATRAVADGVRPAVVHLDVRSSGGPRGSRSAGTGWVYDDKGHIVTNAHVLFGVRTITVNFSDGRVTRATVVGQPDPYTDVAVIKVDDADGLIPARRATGEQPHQGDRVFVFGSPFGFKFSMSQGIVSGLGRDPQTAMDFGGFTNFIQTDAAVNPGNSGGPLVDIHGRVIGMNVAIATGRDSQGTSEDEGQSAGISFAIPLATIESVVDQIIESGSVARGFLGIRWSEGLSGGYNTGARALGVRIGEVDANGPAAAAGLQDGDVITEIGGQPVTSEGVLRSVITTYRPGRSIQVKAWRGATAKDFEVVLGEYPRDVLNKEGAAAALFRYGLILNSRGVVNEVMDESEASRQKLKTGTRIIKIGEQTISNAEQVFLSLADQGFLVGHAVRATIIDEDEDGKEQQRVVTLRPAR